MSPSSHDDVLHLVKAIFPFAPGNAARAGTAVISAIATSVNAAAAMTPAIRAGVRCEPAAPGAMAAEIAAEVGSNTVVSFRSRPSIDRVDADERDTEVAEPAEEPV